MQNRSCAPLFIFFFFAVTTSRAFGLNACGPHLKELRNWLAQRIAEPAGDSPNWRDRGSFQRGWMNPEGKAALFDNWGKFFAQMSASGPDSHMVIDGPDESGKSSMTIAASRAFNKNGISCIVSLDGAPHGSGPIDAAQLASFIADRMESSLYGAVPPALRDQFMKIIDEKGDALGALKLLGDQAAAHGTHVLLGVDGIDHIFNRLTPDAKQLLSEMLNARGVNTVASTSSPDASLYLQNAVGASTNQSRHYTMQPESLASLKSYVEKLTGGTNVRFSDDALAALHESSGGWPGRINEILADIHADNGVVGRSQVRDAAKNNFHYNAKAQAAWPAVVSNGLTKGQKLSPEARELLSEVTHYDAIETQNILARLQSTGPVIGAPDIEAAMRTANLRAPVKLENSYEQSADQPAGGQIFSVDEVLAVVVARQFPIETAPQISALGKFLLGDMDFRGKTAKWDEARRRIFSQYRGLEDVDAHPLARDNADPVAAFNAWLKDMHRIYGDHITLYPPR